MSRLRNTQIINITSDEARWFHYVPTKQITINPMDFTNHYQTKIEQLEDQLKLANQTIEYLKDVINKEQDV